MDVTRRRRYDDALRGLHGLCMWGAKEGLNRLRSIHRVCQILLYIII